MMEKKKVLRDRHVEAHSWMRAHTPRTAREKERPCWGRAGWRCTSTGSSPGNTASPYGYGSPPASVLFLFRTCAGFLSCTLGRVAVHLRARLVELRFTPQESAGSAARQHCHCEVSCTSDTLALAHRTTPPPGHCIGYHRDRLHPAQLSRTRLKSFRRKATDIATACGIKAGHGQQRGVA